MKLIILWMLITSFNMMAMMSKNIMSMWFMMEIGTLLFIYMIIKGKNPLKSSFIYYLISMISSLMIFSSMSISMYYHEQFSFMMENKKQIMTTMAFILKMGIIPFHSWVFKMTENLDWMSMMMLFSIKKIIPIWFLMMYGNSKLISSFLFANLMMAMWLPIKMNNSFFMLSTSNIINSMWIMLNSMSSLLMTIFYSILYIMTNSNLIIMLKKNNSKIKSEEESSMILISMLSLMGFPPLPLFFMKMMTIKNMLFLQSNLMYISIMMMMSNLMSSMMYMKFMLNPMISMKNSKNWKNKSMKKNLLFFSMMIMFTTYFISISIK